MSHRNFSVSIVSHGHKNFVLPLLMDLAALGRSDFELILTLNIVENLEIDWDSLPFPVTLIKNRSPKSFAANHNGAFCISNGDYFVILNPDIRMAGDPFSALLTLLQQNPNSICAPIVVNQNGGLEDSARNFPTPLFLVKKLLGKIFKVPFTSDFVVVEKGVLAPDWVAGMFIVVPRSVYQKLRGLDERYRMYYEDVDFCARARLAGCEVRVDQHAKVIHDAQRASHRNLRYLAWHLSSAVRFFTSKVFLKIQLNRLLRSTRSL